ncbi:hypothetical protein ACQ4PT_024479 [Festuca glaucescens]
MEATAMSMGKAMLDGALGYAKSKAAEEIALQLGVERDVDFITDELQMMQSFLVMADEDNGQNKVFMTWVKQIGDLAYKVEDSLMDFGLHSEKKPFSGCIPRNLSDRRRIAKEVKELRAKVEDVSNRNLRYRLVRNHKDISASNATATEKHANTASAAMLGINEATLTILEQKSEVDLHELITSKEQDLRVIAMWGTSGDHGKMSAIQEVYDDPKVLKKFGICAWVRLMYPFSPQEFLRSLVRQFYENSHDETGKQESEINVGADSFAKMKKMDQNELICVFSAQLRSNSYLIVINDLSTIEEWQCIKRYFPNNKKQSRIIVSTQNVEIASLCTEKPYQVSELRQLSCDQTIYLFHKKNTEENSLTSASMAMFATNEARPTDREEKLKVVDASMATTEIQQEDDQSKTAGQNKVFNSTTTKKFNHSRTLALIDEVLTGRETEKSIVIKLIGQPDNNQGLKVISVWGMGGLGKTTLIRSVYRSQELAVWKHAWVTALRPFNLKVLLRDLTLQLQKSIQDTAGATSIKGIAVMTIEELKVELARLLKTQNCLVVLDDISSTSDWDSVKGCLDKAGRIIITTRERNIAEHCSSVYQNRYNLEGLKGAAALDLFTKKVR